jgi:hypothetical protein
MSASIRAPNPKSPTDTGRIAPPATDAPRSTRRTTGNHSFVSNARRKPRPALRTAKVSFASVERPLARFVRSRCMPCTSADTSANTERSVLFAGAVQFVRGSLQRVGCSASGR